MLLDYFVAFVISSQHMVPFGRKKLDPLVQTLVLVHLIYDHCLSEFICLRHHLPRDMSLIPEIQLVVVPDVYPGDHSYTSLFYTCANHITRHFWNGEVK